MAVASAAACAPRDPLSIAKEADAKAGSGAYTWLAEHDPSAIVVVGIDSQTTQAIAPDARVTVAKSVAEGCKLALASHALLADRSATGSKERDRADDCGFGLFRDDATIVIAPR